jgi:hypothetical protein
MGTNKHRKAGHDFERDIVSELKERGWDVATARYASRMLDDSGVDIAGNYPRKIQCKASINVPKFPFLLDATEADVVFWRKRENRDGKFFKVGEYALIELEDFLNLIDKAFKHE